MIPGSPQMIRLSKSLHTYWCRVHLSIFSQYNWFYVDGEAADQLYFPKLKIRNAKSIDTQEQYSPKDHHYYWFQHPHHLEYSETLKVSIYCPFDFGSFPFETHECNFTFGSELLSVGSLQLTPPVIRHLGVESNDGSLLPIPTERLPFDIVLTSRPQFVIESDGYDFSYTGFTLHLHRNSLGVLIGGFYGPTAIFAILSMISFRINPDIVSMSTFFISCSVIGSCIWRVVSRN